MHAKDAPARDLPLQISDSEFILRQLLDALWRGRWLIFSVSAICVLAAGVASLLMPRKYEATLLLLPAVSQSNASGLGALGSAVSQLGGIASLAGLSVSGTSGAKTESLATLQSEALTERYIQENNLLPILFPNRWNLQQQAWKSTDPDKVPTLWKGNQYFTNKVREVKENNRTGLVTLSITWTDAKVAAQWANGLAKLTNDYLREKAIKESERNIAYLSDQVSKTSVVGLRDSIYALMESEIKKQMLARGNEEYALKVIDPAVPPEKAKSPQPILWILAAFCGGLLGSSAFIFVRFMTMNEPKHNTL